MQMLLTTARANTNQNQMQIDRDKCVYGEERNDHIIHRTAEFLHLLANQLIALTTTILATNVTTTGCMSISVHFMRCQS